LKMEAKKMKKAKAGGFTATREFGFALAGRFKDLDLSEVDTDGVALVVEIHKARGLNLFKLSKVLVGAAGGGVKTAVIDFQERGLRVAIPLFNLFAAVDENVQRKELERLEAAIRTGV